MTKITNEFGKEIDFEAAVHIMDDELREELDSAREWSSEAEFFGAYCAKHREKFDEEFEPNKRNPVW